MTHLTPDELVDAIEETLTPARRAHLHDCPRCAQDVMQLSAVLRESRSVKTPEPSPLFWDRLSDRVRHAISVEPIAPPFVHWFQWPVLAPLAALSLLVFVLASAVPQGPTGVQRFQVAEQTARADNLAASAAIDESWDVMSELLADLDIETAHAAGIAVSPGSADEIALHLSSSEQQELVRLLRAELQRAGG